jgi:hypothetical protein
MEVLKDRLQIKNARTEFVGVCLQIFSEAEVAQFVSDAKNFGLECVGDLKSEIGEPLIEFGGKKYTFGWIVLRKAP